MKIKSILMYLLVILTLAACSNDNDEPDDSMGDFETAYLSIRITQPTKMNSRSGSSEEDATLEESEIKKLCIVMFDGNKKLVHHEDAAKVIELEADNFVTNSNVTIINEAFKVSPEAKYLLVIANPGTVLKSRLDALNTGSSYSDFNAKILTTANAGEDRDKLVEEIISDTNGFAMINVGGIDLDDCLVDISGSIKKIDNSSIKNNAEAKKAAEESPAKLQLERLAAKVLVTKASIITLPDMQDSFEFIGWTFDHRNSTFYPYAKKIAVNGGHTAGIYANNFYTEDPNFENNGGNEHFDGIIKNEVINRTPNVSWNQLLEGEVGKEQPVVDYCIENTMAAKDQAYGAATRLVIKAKYTPAGFTVGEDWFSFGSQNYTFENIITAYNGAIEGSTFKLACDNFYEAVKAVVGENNIEATKFSELTVDDLSKIPPETGGEITKIPNCIRWYQKSLNYYYYEIRHDHTVAGDMDYGKYGVVRNNWYALNLTKVNGKGTPWYPGGGPGDPDDKDPIDSDGDAFLSFEITVGPWLYWMTDFEI